MDTVALGLALGLGAGLSPGPLLGVLIASTLDRGFGRARASRCRRSSPTCRSSR